MVRANVHAVHFTGELVDGTQFVSSRENDIPERFILGQGIKLYIWQIYVNFREKLQADISEVSSRSNGIPSYSISLI